MNDSHLVANEAALDGVLLDQSIGPDYLLMRSLFGRDDGLVHDHGQGRRGWVIARVFAIAFDRQFRFPGSTVVLGVRAARREAAANDLLGQVRWGPGNRRELVLRRVLQIRHRGEQRLGVGVMHGVKQLVGGGLLGLFACVHHHDTVGPAGDDTEVVRDEQHAHIQFLAQ
jgi:hypothetical protein